MRKACSSLATQGRSRSRLRREVITQQRQTDSTSAPFELSHMAASGERDLNAPAKPPTMERDLRAMAHQRIDANSHRSQMVSQGALAGDRLGTSKRGPLLPADDLSPTATQPHTPPSTQTPTWSLDARALNRQPNQNPHLGCNNKANGCRRSPSAIHKTDGELYPSSNTRHHSPA